MVDIRYQVSIFYFLLLRTQNILILELQACWTEQRTKRPAAESAWHWHHIQCSTWTKTSSVRHEYETKYQIDSPFLCFIDLDLLGEFWFCTEKLIQIRLTLLHTSKHRKCTLISSAKGKSKEEINLIWLPLLGCNMEIRSLFIMWKQPGVFLHRQ